MRKKRKEVRIKVAWILILTVFLQTVFPVGISATSINNSIATEEVEIEETVSEETISEDTVLGVEESTIDKRVTSLDGVTVGGYLPEMLDAERVDESRMEEIVGGEATQSKYDPRQSEQDNVLTSVKNQGNFGTCWAFSAIAASEASYNKKAGITGASALNSVDFSERHLAYFTLNNTSTTSDPLGLTKGDSNQLYISGNRATADQSYNRGGNPEIAMYTMANGIGPQSESVVPYADSRATTMSGVEDIYKYQSGIQLNNSRVVDMRDHGLVKQLIIDYGAVATGYYHDINYCKETSEYTSFHYEFNGINHLITLVGWDDTFPKDNFIKAPSADGAWLVKNSWGTDAFDEGYFWMSYETTDFEMDGGRNGYALEVAEVNESNRIYEYDGNNAPLICDVNNGGAIANVFTAAGTTEENKFEVLNRVIVGFYTTDVNYSVQIYKNPISKGNPTSGTALLQYPVKGTTTTGGFYEIPLGKDIRMDKGDVFSVVVTLTKSVSKIYYYVAANVKVAYSSSDYIYCINTNEVGQSLYLDSQNSSWVDFKLNSGISSATARIKACTEIITITPVNSVSINKTLKIEKGKTATLSATIEPANATNKELTWSSSNESIASVDKEGIVTGKEYGTCTITVASSNGKTSDCQVSVVPETAVVSFDSMSGNTVSAQSFCQGKTYGTLPVTQRRGYTFAGWYLDKECTTGNRVTESSVVLARKSYTLYAKWNPLILNVSFDTNGGLSISDRTYTYGKKIGTLPVPYRLGYTSTGWYLEKSCSSNSLVSAEDKIDLIENFKLYAGWKKEKASELLLETDSIEMNVLSTHALKVTTKPANGDYESLTFASDHEDIVSVNNAGLLMAKKIGKATVTVTLKAEEGKIFTKTCSVNVRGYAGIVAVTNQNRAIVGEAVNKESIVVNAYYENDDEKFYIISSDEITVSPNIISKKGTNRITITYPEQKLSTTVTIEGISTQEAQNDPPALQEGSLTINKSKSCRELITVRPAYGKIVTGLDGYLYRKDIVNQYSEENSFTISKKVNNQYFISIEQGVRTGNYKLYVKVGSDEKYYYLPINITVVDKLPKLKVTTTKINAFSADEDSLSSALTITGKEVTGEDVQIDHMDLDSAMNEWYTVSYDAGLEKYSLQLMKSKVTDFTTLSMIPKTGTLFVYLDGYEKSIPVGIKIKIEMKVPKVTLSEKSGIINIYNQASEQKELAAYVDGKKAVLSSVCVDGISSGYLDCMTLNKDGKFVLKMKDDAEHHFAKAKRITITLYSAEWNKGVSVTYQLQIVNRVPSMKLSSKTLTFNRSYGNSYAETEINGDAAGMTDGYVLTDSMLVCTSKNKGYAPKVVISTLSDNKFRLQLYNGIQVKKGTYQYAGTPELEDGTRLKKLSFQVKVTENTGEARVTFQPFNNSKLDLILGEDAYALYHFNFKNIEGNIVDVKTGGGNPFEAEMLEQDGESLLKLTVATKKKISSIFYRIPVILTVIDNNNKKQTIYSEIKLKPVESSLKMSFTGSKNYFYKNLGGTDNVMEIKAFIDSPKDAVISSITCSNNAESGTFETISLPEYGVTRILLKNKDKVKEGDIITFALQYKAGYGKKVIIKKVKVVII